MRKLLVALGMAAIGMVTLVGLASADGGPHGGYTATTDTCSACHLTHTGKDSSVLRVPATDLCLSCHDGTGSVLDVYDGAQLSANLTARAAGGNPTGISGALRGGGFVYARINTSSTTTPGAAFANTGAGAAVKSAHTRSTSLNGLTPQNKQWGSGAAGSGAGGTWSVSCRDCHNPHGNGTYRILNPVPNNGTGAAVSLTDQGATKTYTTTNFWNTYDQTTAWPAPWTAAQMSSWCASCHTRYQADAAAGSTALSGDAIFTYRHVSDGNTTKLARTGSPYVNKRYSAFCLQCHVSHGSNAVVGSWSQALPWPGATGGRGNEGTLLKIDNRGTCVACHGTVPN